MQIGKEQKKEAIRQYKERKPALGVFAVRCSVTGQQWVGTSRNLDATRNSLWFSLRLGNHREAALQQEYEAHGESAFAYRPIYVHAKVAVIDDEWAGHRVLIE